MDIILRNVNRSSVTKGSIKNMCVFSECLNVPMEGASRRWRGLDGYTIIGEGAMVLKARSLGV